MIFSDLLLFRLTSQKEKEKNIERRCIKYLKTDALLLLGCSLNCNSYLVSRCSCSRQKKIPSISVFQSRISSSMQARQTFQHTMDPNSHGGHVNKQSTNKSKRLLVRARTSALSQLCLLPIVTILAPHLDHSWFPSLLCLLPYLGLLAFPLKYACFLPCLNLLPILYMLFYFLFFLDFHFTMLVPHFGYAGFFFKKRAMLACFLNYLYLPFILGMLAFHFDRAYVTFAP